MKRYKIFADIQVKRHQGGARKGSRDFLGEVLSSQVAEVAVLAAMERGETGVTIFEEE